MITYSAYWSYFEMRLPCVVPFLSAILLLSVLQFLKFFAVCDEFCDLLSPNLSL